jgi:hypothetical protein
MIENNHLPDLNACTVPEGDNIPISSQYPLFSGYYKIIYFAGFS